MKATLKFPSEKASASDVQKLYLMVSHFTIIFPIKIFQSYERQNLN